MGSSKSIELLCFLHLYAAVFARQYADASVSQIDTGAPRSTDRGLGRICHIDMACRDIANAREVAAVTGCDGCGASGVAHISQAKACEHMRSHRGENSVAFIMSAYAVGTPRATNKFVAANMWDDYSGRIT